MTNQLRFSPFWCGLGIGSAYAVLLLLALLLRPLARGAFDPGPPAGPLVTAYVLGGALMGAVLHVLWPRVHSTGRAIAAGMASAMPFFFAVRIAVIGFGRWDPVSIIGLAMRIAIGGSLAGLALWYGQRSSARPT